MMIRFVNKLLSIDAFPPTEIADFTVLTGLNGAGKSHLLSAIEKRCVTIDGINQNKIVRFSHDNFRVEGETEYNGQQIENEAQQLWNFFQTNIQNMGVSWMNALPGGADRIIEPEMFKIFSDQIENFIEQNQHLKQQTNLPSLMRTIRFIRRPLADIDRSLFVKSYKPIETRPDSLPSALGKVFLDYHRRQIDNDLIKVQNERLQENEVYLSDTEFRAIHGAPPWEIVDGILSQFNSVQYRVTNPMRVRYHDGFRLRLVSVNDPSLIINFEDLSSGEKVLMALVVLVYKQTTSGAFPELVLLDEIDASLHPSMTQNMLSVLQTVFVERGTKVIMVTHSPSTIALVPEDSIFVVNRTGADKLEKKTRSAALSILTEGFATLEEGLVVFDRSTVSDLSILTEGNNTIYLKEALRHFKIEGVTVVENIEAISGVEQLRTLFDFFTKMTHRTSILFVWDCDANKMRSLKPQGSTIPFVFDFNPDNTIASKGVENLLPADLCAKFPNTNKGWNSPVEITFDKRAKRALEAEVICRNNADDFVKFKPLIDKIQQIRNNTAQT